MTDITVTLLSSAVALAALCIVSLAGLHGWSQWIALRRHEMDQRPGDTTSGMPTTANRIDVADLKERVRKLEAIAAGVDL